MTFFLNKKLVAALCLVASVSACKKIDLSKPIWTPDHVSQKQDVKPTKRSVPAKKMLSQAYYMCQDCLLLPKGQDVIRSRPAQIKGMLENIHLMGDKVQFKGWAADVGNSKPVEKVLIFANQKLVHQGIALTQRLDVAKAIGDGGVIRSGFSFILDKSLFTGVKGKDAAITVYAVNKDNIGAKLPFKK